VPGFVVQGPGVCLLMTSSHLRRMSGIRRKA
jgi:hypothetical protein